MQIDEIHWHDSLILEVRLFPESDLVRIRVLYPENWQENTFEERLITFEDAHGYKEFEGPFEGNPTILGATASSADNDWSQVRIETNAGYRELFCKNIHLEPSPANK